MALAVDAADTRQSTRITFAVLAGGFIAFSLLQSLISPVLADIQRDLHTSQSTVTWLITAYLLSAAVFTPILGRVGDIAGKRKVLVIALLALGIGAAIDGLAPNIGVMILGRAVQGIGGAIIPVAFGIVRDEFPHARVSDTIGALAGLLGLGGAFGTVIAGPIVDALGYRWLFWLPMFVVAIAAAAAFFFVPESPVRARNRVTWSSAILLAAWLIGLLFAVSEAPQWGWLSARVVGLCLGSAALFAAWIANEHRSANPVIDLNLMRLPTVWRCNLVALAFGAGQYAGFAFVPQFIQSPTSSGYGLGVSVTESGLILMPSAGTVFIFGLFAAPLTRRIGARYVVALGCLLSALAFILIVFGGTRLWQVVLGTGLMGASFGLAFSTLSSVLVDTVPDEQTGVANGMNTNVRTIGGAVGAAVVSTLVTSHLQTSGYPHFSGYIAGFIVMSSLSVAAAVVAITLPTSASARDALEVAS